MKIKFDAEDALIHQQAQDSRPKTKAQLAIPPTYYGMFGIGKLEGSLKPLITESADGQMVAYIELLNAFWNNLYASAYPEIQKLVEEQALPDQIECVQVLHKEIEGDLKTFYRVNVYAKRLSAGKDPQTRAEKDVAPLFKQMFNKQKASQQSLGELQEHQFLTNTKVHNQATIKMPPQVLNDPSMYLITHKQAVFAEHFTQLKQAPNRLPTHLISQQSLIRLLLEMHPKNIYTFVIQPQMVFGVRQRDVGKKTLNEIRVQCKNQLVQLLKIEELGANQAQKDDLLYLQLEQDEGFVPTQQNAPQQLQQDLLALAAQGGDIIDFGEGAPPVTTKITVAEDPEDVPTKKPAVSKPVAKK